MQPHEAVDAPIQQLGNIQKGTKCPIGQQNLAGLQPLPKAPCEGELVMVDVIVDHLQKGSAMQAEKADHFEQRKTTAGPLAATLRPLMLVGSRIWHRQTRAVDDFDAPAQPELMVGDLALELLSQIRANLLEHCLIEPRASLTVGAGIARRGALAWEVYLPPSTNSLQSVAAGGAAF
jgi:hypothetical protein